MTFGHASLPGKSKAPGTGRRAGIKRDADRRQISRPTGQRKADWEAQPVLLAAGRVVALSAVVLTFLLVRANPEAGTGPLASYGPAGAALASVVKDVTGAR